jgi:hypothetical protein
MRHPIVVDVPPGPGLSGKATGTASPGVSGQGRVVVPLKTLASPAGGRS